MAMFNDRADERLTGKLSADAASDNEKQDEELEIDLWDLVLYLLDRWMILVASALAGAIIAGVVTFCFMTPVYEATSKLYVVSQKDSAINLSDLQIGNYLAKDYQEVFKNWMVHETVIERLDLPYSYKYLMTHLKVTNPADTRMLYITYTSQNPAEAQLIANTYAEVGQAFIASHMDTREPTMFETALLPAEPSSPSMAKNVVLGFALALVLAGGILVVMYLADDKIRTPEDVEKYLRIPVLGTMIDTNHEDKANTQGEQKKVVRGKK